MISVLFVDDEPLLLEGLKRQLRPLRECWSMRFVGGTEEALVAMEAAPSDVVVSDLRMPGRNGLELLGEVARRWPLTSRVILSGEVDPDNAARSLQVSHHFMSKPCDIERLQATVQRLTRLQEMLRNPALASLVDAMEHLPTVPALYEELVRALEDADTSAARVGQIVARDVSMTATILKMVNSAFFALPRQIADVGDAVRLLGFDLIRTLVLGAGLFRQFLSFGVLGNYVERLSAHAVDVALRARLVAKRLGFNQHQIELAGLAGMLHDIGELVLATNQPNLIARLAAESRQNPEPAWVRENALFGVDHMEVGAYLLSLWNMPETVVEAVAFHHRPHHILEATRPEVVTALHLANFEAPNQCGLAADWGVLLDKDYLERIGLAPGVDDLLDGLRTDHG